MWEKEEGRKDNIGRGVRDRRLTALTPASGLEPGAPIGQSGYDALLTSPPPLFTLPENEGSSRFQFPDQLSTHVWLLRPKHPFSIGDPGLGDPSPPLLHFPKVGGNQKAS